MADPPSLPSTSPRHSWRSQSSERSARCGCESPQLHRNARSHDSHAALAQRTCDAVLCVEARAHPGGAWRTSPGIRHDLRRGSPAPWTDPLPSWPVELQSDLAWCCMSSIQLSNVRANSCAAMSWYCKAMASLGTKTISALSSGASHVKWTLLGWDSTATAPIRGPVSWIPAASVAAVQWAWIPASWDICIVRSGPSTRACRSRHHRAFWMSVGPDTLESTNHLDGTVTCEQATSTLSLADLNLNSSWSASIPIESWEDMAVIRTSKWQSGKSRATTFPPLLQA